MIRPFDWRDVNLVKQLSEQGACLDSAAWLTRENQPLQNALLTYLMPGTGAPTLVWREDGRAGFGQIRHRPGSELARAQYVAPRWAEDNDGWVRLVEHLAAQAGGRGGHNLVAEVGESSGEFEALRLAGFAIYARQSLWRLNDDLAANPQPPQPMTLTGRPATGADSLAVSTLYTNLVPRIVQQVEPLPKPGRGFVFEHDGELAAFLDVKRGPIGIWMEPYLHPEAYDQAGALIEAALRMLASANRAGRPIYVCVRRYQDWLQEILQAARFECIGSQAVMVKRLVARIAEPALKPLAAIEGSATPTPIVRARIEIYKN